MNIANTDPPVEFLGTVEILSVFEPAQLEQLGAQAESRFFKFGEPILSAGERCNGLYVVKTGAVLLFS